LGLAVRRRHKVSFKPQVPAHQRVLPQPPRRKGPGWAGPSDGLFRNAPAGLGLSRRTLAQQDGSPASRNGIVGSWSLSPGMQAGVGLFSVTADGRKQADTRRMPSTGDVAPKRQRITAVGLSLSF
jgi:hypothetical protein